jgi:hypothetical protein
MKNAYSTDDLLEFLGHASDRGLMPATTAQALAVASRNVLGILTEAERADLSQLDIDAVTKRFNNKRAKDFNPASLKEYARRVRRAIDLFLAWREDPANFTIKTRASNSSRKKERGAESGESAKNEAQIDTVPAQLADTYQSSLPVRPGLVVTLANVPYDLTRAEAERLAAFVKMLAVE